jgi:ABC-2 type transport system ATP-binding protein
MSIVVQDVTKFFGAQKALDSVSFEVKTGEIVGFLGPNGAGKSTLMKIITGFIPSSSGKILVNDTETGTPGIRKTIGYLPENNPLYPEMYVKEYLSFVASFYRSETPGKILVDRVTEITGLTPEQSKKIGSLSKGFRQRVGLAQALIHNPSVLILDEATTGLDPNQIIEIRNLIREAGKEKTVLLSTHIMQEVEAICDRVIIIDKGRIVADKAKEDIYSMLRRPVQKIVAEFDREIESITLPGLEQVTSAVKVKGNTWEIESSAEEDIRPHIFNFAVRNGLTVLSLLRSESNLEEVFRHLTGG